MKAEKGGSAPYRRKLDIDKDRTLRRLVDLLSQKMLTFDDFVTCVLKEYTFECFNTKKKKPANPTTACANPVVEEESEVEDDLDDDGEENNSDNNDSE